MDTYGHLRTRSNVIVEAGIGTLDDSCSETMWDRWFARTTCPSSWLPKSLFSFKELVLVGRDVYTTLLCNSETTTGILARRRQPLSFFLTQLQLLLLFPLLQLLLLLQLLVL